jgi:hypothetical protein
MDSASDVVISGHVPKDHSEIAIMEKNAKWPYPARLDGWLMAHGAIRADIRDLHATFDSLEQQVASGHHLESWQADHLREYCATFELHVKQHHDKEEGESRRKRSDA